MIKRTKADAINVRKLLAGTLDKRIKWKAPPGQSPGQPLSASLGNLAVTVGKEYDDDRNYVVWLEFFPHAEALGPGRVVRRDRFTDDDLRDSGFASAAASLVELYALADRQAYRKDELVDALGAALAEIDVPEEDVPPMSKPPKDGDVPF